MPERDAVIDPILLGASERGHRLFRNNSGMAFHKDGSVVRYGVGSPGGSDILGWTRMTIRPEHVGSQLAVFTAIEAKTGTQRPNNDQRRFLEMVGRSGGIALWGTDPLEILRQLDLRQE